MSRRLPVIAPLILLSLAGFALLAAGALSSPTALADVGGVSSNSPTFAPGQPLTITVNAEDDDGLLVITSSLSGSRLSVMNCSGIGSNQSAGECDGSGLDSVVSGQGTKTVTLDTSTLDADSLSELLTVTLTLTAGCTTATSVTVAAHQPGNVGPDDVTVNCIPPTPTPSPTPTTTPTPPPTATPFPTFTPVPPPAAPVATLTSQVLTSTSITPPNTGDAGLR